MTYLKPYNKYHYLENKAYELYKEKIITKWRLKKILKKIDKENQKYILKEETI